jgi:hypothetical protein
VQEISYFSEEESIAEVLQQIPGLSEDEIISLLAPLYNNLDILRYQQKTAGFSDEQIISQWFRFPFELSTEVDLVLELDFEIGSAYFIAYIKVPVENIDEFLAYEKKPY